MFPHEGQGSQEFNAYVKINEKKGNSIFTNGTLIKPRLEG